MPKRPLLLALFTLLGLGGRMTAATVQLTQDGWANGGSLQVSFTGEDLDLDGSIRDPELTAFEADYEFSLGGGTTSWSITDITSGGFRFANVGDFLFFATNNEYTLLDEGSDGYVSGVVLNPFLFPIDLTETAPESVPEPSSMALCSLAGGVVLFRLRRHYK